MSPAPGRTELLERLARLDAWRSTASYGGARFRDLGITSPELHDAVAFVETLYPPPLAGQIVLEEGVHPADIDRVVISSARFWRIAERHRWLHELGSEVWISQRGCAPDPTRVALGARPPAAGKPGGALYTSAGTVEYPGMWSAYVATHRNGTEGRLRAWKLRPLPHAEYVIDSAEEWCDFAVRHLNGEGRIDWLDVAEHVDAVRVTPRGVLSTEGFEFEYDGTRVPAAYWTVESTVWLRWSFDLATELDLPEI
jgi:hypothetical protein